MLYLNIHTENIEFISDSQRSTKNRGGNIFLSIVSYTAYKAFVAISFSVFFLQKLNLGH